MEIIPKIFTAKVMHHRFFPKINSFRYNIYYLVLPISKLNLINKIKNLSFNKFGLISFYEKDHGEKDGSSLEKWINNILTEYSLNKIVDDIMLVAMPRIIGYVFNPVSFWFCLDNNKNIRAVLCQVNNTFKETHCYLCLKEKAEIIKPNDYMKAKKIFHVSPFLERKGSYEFKFSLSENNLKIWIDFYDENKNKQLVTSLIGDLKPITESSLRKVFFKYPLITLKTIFFIHWQAIKLAIKKIKYIPKPKKNKEKISITKP